MRSGYTAINNGYLKLASRNSDHWSSTASSRLIPDSTTPGAYDLGFNAATVNPLGGPDYRWLAFTLHCQNIVKYYILLDLTNSSNLCTMHRFGVFSSLLILRKGVHSARVWTFGVFLVD